MPLEMFQGDFKSNLHKGNLSYTKDVRLIVRTCDLIVRTLTLKYLIPRRVPYGKGRIRKLPYGTRDIP